MKRQIPLYTALLMAVLTACVSILASFFVMRSASGPISDKAAELEQLMDRYYVDEIDKTLASDAVAAAMIESTGDPWSYYIPANDYADYLESSRNAYVGIGITIIAEEATDGFAVISVADGGPASQAGILAGDVLTAVDGRSVVGLTVDEVRAMIRGEIGTTVTVTVLREGTSVGLVVKRDSIPVEVVSFRMLDDSIGYLRIDNFETGACSQSLQAISKLLQQGAKALVFDVRLNPGGKKTELVELLDYLLPQGVVFRSMDRAGNESESVSDETCLDIPMAVLVNRYSYSAAEFFAAALQEYNWAYIIGEGTTGKGRYQIVYPMADGSAVGLSSGRYYTPNGKSLDGTGLEPDLSVSMPENDLPLLQSGQLSDAEDAQLSAAVDYLQKMLFSEMS